MSHKSELWDFVIAVTQSLAVNPKPHFFVAVFTLHVLIMCFSFLQPNHVKHRELPSVKSRGWTILVCLKDDTVTYIFFWVANIQL